MVAPARQQRGGPSDVGALLVDLGSATDDDVLDAAGVEFGAIGQGMLQMNEEFGGVAIVQRPFAEALARGVRT